ncbi:hypothetical protein [Nesterenkonia ebinurensis]|uniref:hypothetical protein n=1 Tax=Nesterenkonia ebinurensis TaxID=2608252 RepID=UPI00123D64EF|nr:hypothetical protein [Nesterenkonia ebinurensis]
MTTIAPTPGSQVGKGAANVPEIRVASPADLQFAEGSGALRYSVTLDERGHMDMLLLNKGSRELLVVFHGATVPGHHHLPRFEWLRTLNERTDFSCLFVSDPTLTLDTDLLLGWYLGWKGMDLYPLLGETVQRAASAVAAEKIILTGSSGGGFASLQVAPYLPGSLAIPFNPQTDVTRYHWNAQASYLRRVMPHLRQRENRKAWGRTLGDRTAATRRYGKPQPNHVLYVQNVRDEHHYHHHYRPFAERAEKGPNKERLVFEEYSAAPFHEPPGRGRFVETIQRGSKMLEQWPG